MAKPKKEVIGQLDRDIEKLHLRGCRPVEIFEQVGKEYEVVTERLEILEKTYKEAGTEFDEGQKRVELDLQYLQIIKNVSDLLDSLEEKESRIKIECYKLIREVIADRSRLWGIDGNGKKVTFPGSIRMNNVETVVLGGNLDKKQLNIIGDIIAGKKNGDKSGSDFERPKESFIECETTE